MVLIACFDRLSFDTPFDAAQFHGSKACLCDSILRRLLGPWSLRRSILVFDVGFNTTRFDDGNCSLSSIRGGLAHEIFGRSRCSL